MNFNRMGRFCIGLAMILIGTFILLLVNYDDYHFPWLLGGVRVSLILGMVMLGHAIAPSAVSALLLDRQGTFQGHSATSIVMAFLWVASFVVLGIAYQMGVEKVDHAAACGSASVSGTVMAIDSTISRGGRVEWAIMEGVTGSGSTRAPSPNQRQVIPKFLLLAIFACHGGLSGQISVLLQCGK